MAASHNILLFGQKLAPTLWQLCSGFHNLCIAMLMQWENIGVSQHQAYWKWWGVHVRMNSFNISYSRNSFVLLELILIFLFFMKLRSFFFQFTNKKTVSCVKRVNIWIWVGLTVKQFSVLYYPKMLFSD